MSDCVLAVQIQVKATVLCDIRFSKGASGGTSRRQTSSGMLKSTSRLLCFKSNPCSFVHHSEVSESREVQTG